MRMLNNLGQGSDTVVKAWPGWGGGPRVAIWGLIVSVAAAPAMADSASAAPEQIVVTGERRGAVYADEPGNVAVFSAEALTRINADHIQEALNRAPGVFIHRGSGQEHLTAIRSPVLTGGAGAGSFLFLQDGVPLRSAGFGNVNGLFESLSPFAEAVEVVRGPGSALSGSNAVHGLVNVLTPAPDADETRLSVSLSTLQRTKAQAVVERIGPSWGVAAGLDVLNDNGWREPAGVDEQKGFVRWRVDTGGRWSADTSIAFTNLNQETAGFEQGPDAYENSAASRTNEFPQAYRDAQTARIQSRLDVALEEGWTLSVTPYARWQQMEFLQHFLPSQGVEDNGHWSVGALATFYGAPSPRLELVAGVDGEVTRGFLQEFQPQTAAELGLPVFLADDFPGGLNYDYAVDALTFAAYGEAEIALLDRWRVEAGLRAEATRYDYDTAVTGDIGRFRRPDDRTDDFVTLTPKLGLLRRLDGGGGVYVRYARGARAPQTTDLYRLQTQQDVAAADPETLDSLEAGWRGMAGDVSFETTAFWMEKRNFFFRDADGLNVTDGRTRHTGVEFALSWAASPSLSFFGAGTYAAHTYRFDRAANGIVSGADIDTAPEWLVNAQALWTPGFVEFELGWTFVDDYFLNPANTETYPGHHVFELRSALEVTGGVQLFAIVRNLTNTDYAERADFAFGNERYFPGEDRNLTLGLRARW